MPRLPERTPRAQTSPLAIAAVVLAILGPVGAVCAIVFGWAARRDIAASGGARGGRGLATAAIVLGVALLVGEGALIAAWVGRHPTPPIADEPRASQPVAMPQEPAGGASAPLSPPSATAPEEQGAPPPSVGAVPKSTRAQRVGAVTLVDVGMSVSSLADELAKQRAEAMKAGETLVLMATTDECAPCRAVGRSLASPLMQTALAKVRLVRVDVYVFDEDLTALHIPHDRIPGFFLLGLDLTPNDGIDGGEWDDDIPPNMAPVLGAFVRGQYVARRNPWQAPPGTGVRL